LDAEALAAAFLNDSDSEEFFDDTEELAEEDLPLSDEYGEEIIENDNFGSPEKSKKSQKSPKKPKKWLLVLSRILAIVASGSLVYLGILITIANVLPLKYLVPMFIIIALLSFLFIFKAFRKKTRKPVRIILAIFEIITAIISIFGIINLDKTLAFLQSDNFGANNNVAVFNVIVNDSSSKTSLSDLSDDTVYAYRDLTVDSEKVAEKVREKANAGTSFETDLSVLTHAVDETVAVEDETAETASGVETAEDPAIMIHNSTYDEYVEENPTFAENTRIIGTISVEIDSASDSVSDITTEPFIVYLSGIDTRSGTLPERSLSDVNMVMAVNPQTRQLLLVSIPRDYYVKLHGTSTSDYNDKLTHAGGIGGVQLSMSTIEDLLDIDINYYARVNFNFVENLVDAIGGITVNSDVDYSFSCWEDRDCTFYPGDNDVDGHCALAFARERHAYTDGDRHRGKNQEQVIEVILDKVTSSSTILSKYSDILNALDGTFETSLTTNDITAFVKMHINDMTPWRVYTSNLDGTTGSAYTYSYSGQKLSVMFPDEKTITTAQEKITQLLNGEEITENDEDEDEDEDKETSTTSTSTSTSTTTRK